MSVHNICIYVYDMIYMYMEKKIFIYMYMDILINPINDTYVAFLLPAARGWQEEDRVVYTYTYMHIYKYLYIYFNIHVSIYIYTYIYTYMYICIGYDIYVGEKINI